MRRLIQTSVGTVEVDLEKGWGQHTAVAYDEQGWESQASVADISEEFEFTVDSLGEMLTNVGVPQSEAGVLADRIWSEWIQRGGGRLTKAENLLGGGGALLLIVVLVAGWLAGAAFVVWLIAKALI